MASSITSVLPASYYSGQTALSLLSSASSGAASDTSSLLLSYYQAQDGISSDSSAATPTGPAAPWDAANPPSVSDTVQKAVDGAAFVDPSAAKLSAPAGASTQDYQNLFALYQGLNTLLDLAQTAQAKPSAGSISATQLQSTFASGLGQVQSFLATDPFSAFNVTAGTVSQTEQSSVGVANGSNHSYTTGVIATGDRAQPMAVFASAAPFTISIQNTYSTTPTAVTIDLSKLASQPPTIDAVVNYINAKLKAAGVGTTFSVASLGAAPATTTTSGAATAGAQQWGLTVNGVSSEVVTFSAAATAPAVYVGEATGGAATLSSAGATGATPKGEQLIKLQASNAVAALAQSSDSTLPVSGLFSKGLPSGVGSVQASATAADGSVYLVADVSGAFNGAPVPGGQGVALLKYDAAGKLLYGKLLAGAPDATGASVAVNTDGTVAVAGSTTTPPTVGPNGISAGGSTSAFVQVFDSTGAPSWSQTVPAEGGTATAAGVAFGPKGSVYLLGTTTGSVGNQVEHGASDAFIQGFTSAGVATSTNQFGSSGDNSAAGLAYDPATGALYAAGVENSQGVVRRFDLNGTGKPTLAATANIGAVQSLVGVAVDNGQVVVGGNVSGPSINVGSVAQPFTGVGDGFVATLSTDLAPADGTVSYVGVEGATETATSLAVADGQAFLTGTIANDPNSVASSGATEGFVVGIDAATGATDYATRFSGPNGQAAPSTVAVAGGGASVLDQLGLPQGVLNPAASALITANTSVKAGDSFYIRTAPGGPQTAVTVSATDTLASLATKINGVLGPLGKASVLSQGASSTLLITPSDNSAYIELDPSQAGGGLPSSQPQANVLGALGLSQGVIRTVKTVNGVTDVSQLREYGLDLPATLDISSVQNAQSAATALQAAISVVQQAYQDLVNPPTLASEEQAKAASSSGDVPAYLTNEIANYQAGLQRLLGGG